MATSAVADLQLVGSGPFGHGQTGDFDSALLRTTDDRELVIRVPANEQSASDQSVELIALSAMTAGIRSRLPFDVPTVQGQASIRGTRAVVYDYLPGYNVDAARIPAGDGVATSIGAAIAAIHSLPGSFVAEVGLPALTAADCRTAAHNIIERAAATRLLPAAVKQRWTDAAADDALWQFQPTVINGSLSAESFVITDHEVGPIVTGVIGWGSLRVGDPARDLHWLSGAGEAADSVLAAYRLSATRHPDRLISQRSMLHAELELARWLLHGVDTRDQQVIDDAVSLLDGLVDHVLGDLMHPLSPQTGPIMAVADVEEMLAHTPQTRGSAPSSSGIAMETDSYDRSQLEEALAADDAGRSTRDEDTNANSLSNTDAIETGPINLVSVQQAAAASRVAQDADHPTADARSRPASSAGTASPASSAGTANSSGSDSAPDAYTAELDFSTLEAAESGEITPLTQRRPSSSAE
ncbi:aminoglycoside phosphotransferase (APT) family kinase protein [Okibacterium sp. HSC-33S16]|uniref:phosphotransferase n=1 Tax=Okibacterium sp. HSC-33S16 TaxID=2910965 RepID=UPI00209CE0C0|nr:phosphotransferase [Okibacterium sp. HSC-33S16]MCP2030427.1 aminoglycoside phosphotransferase (APT) family kinase protein [Okibacterium sp. HSC-33S16]